MRILPVAAAFCLVLACGCDQPTGHSSAFERWEAPARHQPVSNSTARTPPETQQHEPLPLVQRPTWHQPDTASPGPDSPGEVNGARETTAGAVLITPETTMVPGRH